MQSELARAFGRIGILSFGGPAAQIALLHRVVVEEKRWLTEAEYLRALSFCMLLPGPEAMQLATYAGWRVGGLRGGLIAGGLFVLPGAVIMAALAAAYVAWGHLALAEGVFLGIKAAVVVIVIEALLRVARRALKQPLHQALAVLSFAATFALHLFFPAAMGDGPAALPLPDWSSLDLRALGLALAAGVALLRLHWPLTVVLGLCAAAGLAL